MRLSAYILAADPAWIEASVLSYYDIVDKVIVSYDENAIGWTGVPIQVSECLERLRAIDRAGKFRYCPGQFARLEHRPMENETHQRQCALNEAGKDSDWVMQLDTDEMLAGSETFLGCIQMAHDGGYGGMEYPSRWLYKQVGPVRFLEHCNRAWRSAAGFPGAMAVRAGTLLRYARQADVALFRVDFRSRNTDPAHPKDARVDRVIHLNEALIHYAWVRDEQAMLRKSKMSGHAYDLNWNEMIEHWMWAGRHPILAVLQTPILRRKHGRQLRLATISQHTQYMNQSNPIPVNAP